ncbi:MAG: TrmH family RNA methyltransferase [Methylophagaceae bacterium]
MTSPKVSIGLVNPKSPDNVGSVMRAAGNYQVDRIFYTGTRYPRALSYQPRSVDMSRKVSNDVSVKGVIDLVDSVADDMTIVCVEFALNAHSLPEFEHPENAFYIFGPEDGSINQEVIERADAVVYIPTIGCMNLAATVNVVLYDRLAKRNQFSSGNDLIRQSRDRNNRLKKINRV